MPLLVRMPEKPCSTTRIREVVSPASPGLGLSSIYLGFVYLGQGERRGFDFGPLDTVMVVMGGSIEAGWEDADRRLTHGIAAGRHDVFDGAAWAICAAPYTTLFVKALSAGAELALIRAELIDENATEGTAESPEPGVVIIPPHAPRVGDRRGAGPVRQACQVASIERRAGREGEETRRLVVGETLALAGVGCDAALCQDDDVADGADPSHEEVRHFRFRPAEGGAIQSVCSPSRTYDHTYQVRHGDTIAVQSGLRPKDPTCDCDLYILWARAGVSAANTRMGQDGRERR